MDRAINKQAGAPFPLMVPAGEDRFGEFKSLGISQVSFKVSSRDHNDIFIAEISFHKKGGPMRHLHHEQDEWFYVLEGTFLFETGRDRFHLYPGDSLLIPRKMPHAWAFAGDHFGKFLVTYTPADNMEEFFQQSAKAGVFPGPDPELWRPYGMELLGPPLPIEEY